MIDGGAEHTPPPPPLLIPATSRPPSPPERPIKPPMLRDLGITKRKSSTPTARHGGLVKKPHQQILPLRHRRQILVPSAATLSPARSTSSPGHSGRGRAKNPSTSTAAASTSSGPPAAKFSSGPRARPREAYKRTRSRPSLEEATLVTKKENVFGKRSFCTRVRFDERRRKEHDILIENSIPGSKEPEMWISVDGAGGGPDELIKTAKAIATPGKGILAADETHRAKRLAQHQRRERRVTPPSSPRAPGALRYLSGVILFEETLYQSTVSGKPFVDVLVESNVIPGIKVDKGTVDIAGTNGETTTQGFDSLGARWYGLNCMPENNLQLFQQRQVLPGRGSVRKVAGRAEDRSNRAIELSIQQNAQGLARYAIICQENGLVPIVEPEILTDGGHGIEKCAAVTEKVLAATYKALNEHHVLLEGTLLKPNMVTPGSDSPKVTPQIIAEHTVKALRRTVPPAVPGIVFLSGGQSEEDATLNLDAMNKLDLLKPWTLSFSFGRALQQSTIKNGGGSKARTSAAAAPASASPGEGLPEAASHSGRRRWGSTLVEVQAMVLRLRACTSRGIVTS
ncbi:uncharacterized protein A4U43_C01F35280 [Asparagus officinalis]|uniref:Fructose-bisphosphate aldolase n=1 Tax=Asparagus officinalis TaxID=4686 RepID=A0A5P1FUV6_ASPOF|nr:uncharacterized protein A4U43_C01F35280 [Asparagus officinalis]